MDEFILKGWRDADGDNTLRVNYDLPKNPIIFDLGGYKGEWTDKILQKHPDATVYIFEPVDEFYLALGIKYAGLDNVRVLSFALGKDTKSDIIHIDDNCSSLYTTKGKQQGVQCIDIFDFLRENEKIIPRVDLMKINIEGAEYELLEHMSEMGIFNGVTNIQIQFHDFIPNAIKRRNKIQKELSLTHHLTYEYPFVWENWKKGL